MSKKLAQSSLGLLEDVLKQSTASGKRQPSKRQAKGKAKGKAKLSAKHKQAVAEKKVLEKLGITDIT
jgi:hypothetical protein